MNSFHPLCLSLLCTVGGQLLTSDARAQTLLQYDPLGVQGSAVPVPASNVAAAVTASDLSQVGFIGSWGNTDVWPVGQIGTASTALDPAQYVTFDVSATAAVLYTSLSYSRRSYLGEGNRQAAVRTSLDGFMSDVDAVTGLVPTGDEQIAFDLSSLPPTTGGISFRIYLFDSPTTGVDWVDLVSSNSGGTGIVLSGAPFTGLGTPYCAAVTNSTGQPAAMSALGSSAVSSNDVTLTASDLPLNAFGFFLTSRTQGFVPGPGGSQGSLCLAGSIGRYIGAGQIQSSGTAGSISLALDLTQHPTPTGLVSVAAGETWNFQAWYRDSVSGSATSNFSDGLEIDFL